MIGLFVAPAVAAIGDALASAGADEGSIAVVGNAKLATALATARTVVPIALSARAAKKVPGAIDDFSTVADRSLAAVVGVSVAEAEDWEAQLAVWTRAVRDGGAVVFVDRGHAPEAARRALCAGLTEIEQRHAGRTIVTSGLVTHL
ncbi:MAG TPA: hypothetical protein VGM88_13765 [Kofleriaceae bacterium]|jgi:hypothetical protein